MEQLADLEHQIAPYLGRGTGAPAPRTSWTRRAQRPKTLVADFLELTAIKRGLRGHGGRLAARLAQFIAKGRRHRVNHRFGHLKVK